MIVNRVGVIQVSRDLEIVVNLDEARCFVADVGGVEVRAGSFDELEKKVRAAVSRQKVQHQIRVVIEVKSDTTTSYIRAVLRGRNERTREYLVTVDGVKKAIEYLTVVALSDEVSDTQLAVLNDLQHEADEATARVREARRALAAGKDLTPWKLLEASTRALTEAPPPPAAGQ